MIGIVQLLTSSSTFGSLRLLPLLLLCLAIQYSSVVNVFSKGGWRPPAGSRPPWWPRSTPPASQSKARPTEEPIPRKVTDCLAEAAHAESMEDGDSDDDNSEASGEEAAVRRPPSCTACPSRAPLFSSSSVCLLTNESHWLYASTPMVAACACVQAFLAATAVAAAGA